MLLPDRELVASAIHRLWMKDKLKKGIASCKAEDGEELMVPYEQLSEFQKDQDRNLVAIVYTAIQQTAISVKGA